MEFNRDAEAMRRIEAFWDGLRSVSIPRRWKIFIVASTTIIVVLLVSLLVIVPSSFSNRFISSRFEPVFIGGILRPSMRIEWIDGRAYNVNIVGLRFWWNNSYFVPVQIHYNGFEYVMLVYNSTVDDPADVAKNKDHLVWGAWIASYELNLLYGGGWTHAGVFESKRAYDFYISHKDFTNYTKTISPGEHYYKDFVAPMVGDPVWYGQDLRGNPISPGTYYIYFILYGIVAEPAPFELKVLNVYWED